VKKKREKRLYRKLKKLDRKEDKLVSKTAKILEKLKMYGHRKPAG
jgi:hypothetical protein